MTYNVCMAISDAVQTLERDLRDIFGSRLQSLVVYGSARSRGTTPTTHAHTVTTRRRRTRSRSSTR